MQVALQSIACVECRIGVFYHFLQVSIVDARQLVGVCVILTIGLVEIHFSQEGSCGSLRRASFLSLRRGQHSVGFLQIVDDLLPAFVVGIFRIREVVVVIFLHVGFVDEGNLLEQAFHLEVTIGAQELHLCRSLTDGGILLISSAQHVERQGDTGEVVVKTFPDGREGPGFCVVADASLQMMERLTVREV